MIRKYPKADTREGLQAIIPDTLKYLRDSNYIDESAYEKEYDKYVKLVLEE